MYRSVKHVLAGLALFSVSAFGQISSSVVGREVEVVGTVRGVPARTDCAVELSNVRGYAVAQQAVCDRDGGFQFMQVPRGVYNLVVRMGTNEYTEEVHLEAPREQVEIEIPENKPAVGSRNTVSVAEMRIPENAKNDLQKANRELAEGKLDKADEYVQKALAKAPQFAQAMTIKAVILMAKNDFPSALQLTEKAAKVDPMLGLTQVVMASALNSMGRAKEAQAAAEQGLRLDGSWQGHYELARAMMTQQHYKHALQEITKAMAAGPPRFGDLMLLRASALMYLKDVAAAREAVAEFMKERPGDPRGTRMMAVLNAK